MTKAGIDYEELLSVVARSIRPNVIRKLTSLLGRGDMISFAAGAPSLETFPTNELAEIAACVMRERGSIALQYGPTRGRPGLVSAIASSMRSRGIEGTEASQVVVTTGSQQGLDLVARVVIDPGDVALVELPSYVGGIIALHNSRAELVGVRQDQDGISIEDLRKKIHQAQAAGRRVKCIYTIPNFQNPSGVTLARNRRHELVNLAEEHNLLIIEDDPYFQLYFSQETSALTPLVALAPSRVVYLSSFSKVLAPGLRIAWLRAPEAIASKIELVKEGADLSSSQVDQAIVLEALRSGLIERRLPGIREFYACRCRAMLDALQRHAPPGSRWTRPLGGFFVWMELAGGINSTDLLPATIESGVAYVPGQPFCVDGSGENALRLAFSKETPEKIAEGVEKLCRVLSGPRF